MQVKPIVRIRVGKLETDFSERVMSAFYNGTKNVNFNSPHQQRYIAKCDQYLIPNKDKTHTFSFKFIYINQEI